VRDLRKHYDRDLLKLFYDTMMVPNFGQFEDELEDVEIWIELLEKQESKNEFNLHVLLVINKDAIDEASRLMGGCACEYYPQSNCGLLTYFAVDPKFRNKGIGRYLVSNVLTTLNGDAVAAGREGLSALFLETNDDTKVSAADDVIDPAVRHKILNRLGFSILKFQYVQPALSEEQEKCSNLLLGLHQSFFVSKDEHKVFNSSIILDFITEFFIVLMGKESLVKDADYLAMKKELSDRDHTIALN